MVNTCALKADADWLGGSSPLPRTKISIHISNFDELTYFTYN